MRSFGSFSRLGRCGDSSSLTSQSFRASHAFCLNFVSFSRLGRCGDSSSLTSQSFRASNDLYGIFPGIVYFLLNLLALSRVGGLPLLMEGFNV
ncbi:hypothetical protein NC653_026902 [Populus alba x Populus x berolinensis]|uniref:Uncharacterized protein n=1 Tax=Populus alba x Populus x berolinensis TaxID=444605 RepID=A0AAD6M445_9ROSI|nr:hypothetical protein NC653_026902 [Populus alba x Populus x berolinensis]